MAKIGLETECRQSPGNKPNAGSIIRDYKDRNKEVIDSYKIKDS